MTWWLRAKLSDGAVGWMKLKAVPDRLNFPMFSTREALQSGTSIGRATMNCPIARGC